MKSIKQIALVLIALLAAAILVGCGGSSTDNEATSGSIVFDSATTVDSVTTTDLRIMFGTGASQELFQADGQEPSFRSDGQMVAFIGAFNEDDDADLAYDVCIINTDGTGLVKLTDNAESASPTVSNPAISPDGTQVAYTHTVDINTKEIRLVDSDGTNDVQLVASGNGPAFSPDGTQIAFARGNDIFTIDVDGSNETNVINNASGTASAPEFSPSGDEIVYALDTTIMLFDIAGATQTDIVTNAEHPTFKPDATRIAFVRDNMIFSVNMAGTDLQQLTSVTDGTVHNNPSWAVTP